MIMKNSVKRGFVKTVIIIVIALIVLGYFGYNLEDIVKSPTVQKNLRYVWDFVVSIWNNYLIGPVKFIWDKIIVGVIWESIQRLIANSHGTIQ